MARRAVRAALATLGAGVAVAVLATAATITPTAAQDPVPVGVSAAASCITDAGGYCTVRHELGVVPSSVLVTPHIPAGWKSYLLTAVKGSATAESFRLRAVGHDGQVKGPSHSLWFSYQLHGEKLPEPPPTTTTTTMVPPTTTTPPPGGAWPTEADTGVPDGTQLEVVTGNPTYSTAGQVVEGKDIRGCINVKAPGVVIRNSKISGDCFYLVDAYGFTGDWARIEDSTLVCTDGGTAIGEERFVALRVDVSGCENGFDINGQALIEDSYIHDMLQEGGPGDPHSDGAQLVPGATDVTFRHNRFDMTTLATSSVISPSGAGATRDITIDRNLVSGGGYSIYCNQGGAGINYRLIGNRFSTKYDPDGGRAAPWTECTDEAVVTDNRWYDGAKAGQLLPGHP